MFPTRASLLGSAPPDRVLRQKTRKGRIVEGRCRESYEHMPRNNNDLYHNLLKYSNYVEVPQSYRNCRKPVSARLVYQWRLFGQS